MLPWSLVLVVAACAYDSQAALLGDRISYLAYGSNLHPAVFERRRGIKPLAMSPAVAPGWRLAFDLRGGGAEPSFASARPDARRELYGALYDLTPSDWARVCASEGVPFGYVVCPVRCRKLDDGEIEWAYTLAAPPVHVSMRRLVHVVRLGRLGVRGRQEEAEQGPEQGAPNHLGNNFTKHTSAHASTYFSGMVMSTAAIS